MKITALEEYGLRCMLLLAKGGVDKPLTLPEFASAEGLSLPYAGKLLMILRKSGLVSAVRGRNGGYVLAKHPKHIILREIFDVLGERLYDNGHCSRHSGEYQTCAHKSDCKVKAIWENFDSYIYNTLDKITLEEMATGKMPVLQNNDNA